MHNWIYVDEYKPPTNMKIEVLCDGGQFAGKWTQTADFIDGHFYYQDINLDKEVYAWRCIN